ncbi:MAG: metal ABC transporter permease [Gammaproteobacteria bacterium]
MNTETLDLAILIGPLAAGALVLATHVPLGQYVLARGISFIDLAIAQIAALGVLAAQAAGLDAGGWPLQASAAVAAIVGALVLYGLERRYAAIQEALIGSAFVLAAAAGIMLLATHPHGGEHLRDLLAGQILWVAPTQLLPAALLTAALLIAWFVRRGAATPLRFYLVFALAVTASVQLVGVYLVFASLILPALATRNAPPHTRLLWGYGVGVLGYIAGSVFSIMFDLPTGATIVWSLALSAIAIALVRRTPVDRFP